MTVYNIEDENERRVFRRLPENEKFVALYEIMTYNRNSHQELKNELAVLIKDKIALTERIDLLEKNLNNYREMREKRESKLYDVIDTAPPTKNMTPEQKQNTMDKIIAVAVRKQDNIRELIRLAIIVATIIGSVVGVNRLSP